MVCIHWSKSDGNIEARHRILQVTWEIHLWVRWHWEVGFWLDEGCERISLSRAELYLACLWISLCILNDLIMPQMSNVTCYCWSEPKWRWFSVATHVISNVLSATRSLTPKIAIYGTQWNTCRFLLLLSIRISGTSLMVPGFLWESERRCSYL